MLKKALLIACLFSFIHPAPAAEPEQNPYDSPNLFGQAIWIGEGKERFPAILTEAAAPEARGLVILLHAEGEHPEWPQVIHTLRRDLTDHGWTTLALEMPPVPATTGRTDLEALADEMDARLTLAINQSRQWNPPLLIIIGHGMAASVALNHVVENAPPDLLALVGISMSANRYDPPILDSARALKELKLPILDICAERDRLEVLKSRKRRARAARQAGNRDYRQLVLPGTGIHFYSQEALLSKRVRSWLDAEYRKLERPRKKPEEPGQPMPMTETTPAMPAEPASPPQPAPMPAPDNMGGGTTGEPTPMPAPQPPNPPAGETQTPPPATQPPQPQESMPNPTGPGGLF